VPGLRIGCSSRQVISAGQVIANQVVRSRTLDGARRGALARRWLALAVACLLATYVTILLVNSPFTFSLVDHSTAGVPLGDFGSFFASGRAAAQGLNPFDVYPLTMDAELGRGHGAAVNLNAPLSVPLFQMMAGLDPAVARVGWFVATVAAYATMVGLFLHAYPARRGPLQVTWPFAMAGFWETINLGQVYVFLALISTAAWLMLGRRPVVAGALIGFIVAFKPNFVVWPLLLLLTHQRRTAISALASATLFCLLPVLLYGPNVYAQWLEAIGLEQVNAQVANASVGGLLARIGAPPWLWFEVSAMGLVGLAAWAWRQRPSARNTSGMALVGLLLCSPLAWVGYSVFLLPLFASRRGFVPVGLSAALLCIPRLLLQEWADGSPLLRVTVGSAYTVAWMLLVVVWLRSRQVSSD
jgi:hypothetical protein